MISETDFQDALVAIQAPYLQDPEDGLNAPLPRGWSALDVTTNSNILKSAGIEYNARTGIYTASNGFKAVIVSKNGQDYIAFSGLSLDLSNLTSTINGNAAGDLTSGAELAWERKELVEQEDTAMRLFLAYAVANPDKANQVKFAGLSLGGGLAEFMGGITGNTAYAFNSVGAKNAVDSSFAPESFSKNTYVFIDQFDPIGSFVGQHSGNVYRRLDPLGKFFNVHTFPITSPEKYSLTDYLPPINTVSSSGMIPGWPVSFANGPMQRVIDDWVNAGQLGTPSRLIPLYDPILLDLNGNGIETTSVEQGTYFDKDADGFAEQSAWVGNDDGILAIDRNHDGIINDGTELFGDATPLSGGGTASDGYAALADLDSNSDGKIDTNDAAFGDLRILKGDGSVYTLSDLDIKSLSLSNSTTGTTDAQGNTQLKLGSYTKTDNTTLQMGDYNLQGDAVYSFSNTEVPVSSDVAALPEVQGYGLVHSLQQAMMADATLKGFVQDFVNETDISTRNDILDNILFQWAGSQGVDPSSRGDLIDARYVAVLEKFMAESYGIDITNTSETVRVQLLTQAYANLKEYVNAQLVLQTQLKDLASLIQTEFDPSNAQYKLNFDAVTNKLDALIAADSTLGKQELGEFYRIIKGMGWDDASKSNYSEFYSHFASMGSDYQWAMQSSGKEILNGTSGADGLIASGLPFVITGGDGNDSIQGGISCDAIDGGTGDDRISGDAGNNLIYGGDGNDTIEITSAVAGIGQNTLYGGTGNDTIAGGNGDDWISGDTGNDLINGVSGNDTILGGDGNDSISLSTNGNSSILAGAGNDTIYNSHGDDTISFGTGADYVDSGSEYSGEGPPSNDTYIYNVGDGSDTITESHGNDTIRFGAGITLSNVVLQVQDPSHDKNLQIIVGDPLNGDVLTVLYQFGSDANKQVENFVFSDGTTITASQLTSYMGTSGDDSIVGTSLNETLYGYAGNDVIGGGTGNDTIYGGDGNDYLTSNGGDLVFGGNGNDALYGGPGNNTLEGEAGDDQLLDGPGNHTLDGGAGNDIIDATTSSSIDYVLGGDGNDTIHNGAGRATFIGGAGNDYISGSGYELSEGVSDDTYIFNLGDGQDTIEEYAGTDTLQFGPGISSSDVTFQSINSGHDLQISITGTTDQISILGQLLPNSSRWIDTFVFDDITLSAQQVLETIYSGNDSLTGTGSAESLMGFAGNDVLSAQGSDDTIVGGSGNDTSDGGTGNDLYLFSDTWGTDTLSDSSGTDTVNFTGTSTNLTVNLVSNIGDEVSDGTNTVNWSSDVVENVVGGSGNDSITGNSADNQLTGAGGNDTLDGASGNDTYAFANTWGSDSLADVSGTDTVDFSAATANLTIQLTSSGSDEVTDGTNTANWASDVIENAVGGSGNDNLSGSSGANSLVGGIGNDTLDGLAGNDSLDGGDGNDTYAFSGTWGVDTITGDSSGTDTVDLTGTTNAVTINLISGVGDEVTDGTNTINWSSSVIDNALGGSGNDSITGNSADNRLTGADGNDTLDGAAGNDTYGFSGTWGVDTISDASGIDTVDLTGTTNAVTINLASSGSDEVTDGTNTVNWSSDVIDNAIGGSGNDTVTGNSGDNRLTGAGGNDALDGSSGNDAYAFSGTWGIDTISDASGTDTVDFTGTTANLTINLTSSGSNEVTDGTNTVNWSSDVIENAIGGSGNDNLNGSSGANSLVGGIGNDTLDGLAGNDSLNGGDGNDVYLFDNTWGSDSITGDSGGTDTLNFANVSSNLSIEVLDAGIATDGTNSVHWDSSLIENLIGGSGNDFIQVQAIKDAYILLGGAGNDTLQASHGDDSLDGGDGNDLYTFTDSPLGPTDADNHFIITGDSSGIDTVNTFGGGFSTINLSNTISPKIVNQNGTIDWTGDFIENVIGSGSITGNAYDNVLGGYGNDDTLVGAGGNDSLDAGAGNDTYGFSGTWGADTITGDTSGTDTVDLTGTTAAVTINLSSGAGNEVTDDTNTINWSSDVIENAIGGSGNDSITGSSGANRLTGAGGNDTLDGASGNDTYGFSGTWGVDTISDASGSDTVDFTGATANLTIHLTSSGSDEVTDGTNTINWSSDVIENAIGGSGNDNITGNTQANLLNGNAGNDTLNGAGGNDTLDGGAGNDSYIFNDNFGISTISGDSSGTDILDFSGQTTGVYINLTSGTQDEVTDGTDTINISGDFIENAVGGSGSDYISGNSLNNSLIGGTGDDILVGGSGNDTLDGGTDDDTYAFTNTWGIDTLSDSAGNDTVDLRHVSTNLSINLVSDTGAEVTDSTNTINWASNAIENAVGGLGNDTMTGNNDDNYLDGYAGNDTLSGGSGNDSLMGGSGNDTLDGGADNDTYAFTDGWGVDTITADSAGNDSIDFSGAITNLTINLASGAGNEASDGYNTVNWASDLIENAVGGSGNDNLTGNSAANVLYGGGGHDTLIGAGANDSLDGGSGNDTYGFSSTWGADTITSDSSGTDTVDLTGTTAAVTINLTTGASNEVTDGTNTVNWSNEFIENAIGGSGNDTITGNTDDNQLSGAAGNDTLIGGVGNDTVIGGSGNDSLVGGDGDDVYAFNGTWGTDALNDTAGSDTVDLTGVSANLTVNLATGAGNEVSDGTNVLNWASDFIENAIGGSGNDSITGNSGANRLTGAGGNDTLDGASGNDTYGFNGTWGVDTISDASGTDTIDFTGTTANVTIHLTSSGGDEATDGTNTVNWASDVIENAIGGSGNDTILGSTGDNRLTGAGGNDSLAGDAGNDAYAFTDNWSNDTIADSAGTDTVDFTGTFADLTINLTSGTDHEVTDSLNTVDWSSDIVENAMGGFGYDSITGNSGANSLSGGEGQDTLTGLGGNDSLDGGTGDDIYAFSGTWGADTITADSSGTDTVDLTGTTAAVTINLTTGGGDEITDGTNTVNWASDVIENAIGGSGNDTITGNSSANQLTGVGGNDTLDGAAGNDIYTFTGTWGADSLTDASGTDTVNLTDVVKDLTINLVSGGGNEVTDGTNTINWASDVVENIVGGSGNDNITGSSAANILIGGAGYDTLIGGDGNDNLDGGAGVDSLLGGNGDDTLYGDSGNDSLDGGSGNDLYSFQDGWDVDTITADASGTDTVDFSFTFSDLTINLTSGGGNEVTDGTNTLNWSSDVIENAIGGYGNDTITGNTADNQLTGGFGDDSLDGGAGNDTYQFSAGWGLDTITADTSGTDTVDFTGTTAALTIQLTSSGSDEVTDGANTVNWSSDVIENAMGGSGNDTVTGNSAANRLTGAGGNDTLDGGSGADTLLGGTGNDIYTVDNVGDVVTENAAEGTDLVQSSVTYTLSSDVENLTLTGSSNINGTGNTSDNILIGNTGNNTLDGNSGNDTYILANSWGIDSIADSAGTDTLDLSGTTTNLTVNLVSGAGDEVTDGTNTVNWSSDAIENLMGGSGNDSITGNSSANRLTGGSGNDTLTGGAGNDTYILANSWGIDSINDSAGTDTVDLSGSSANLTINLTAGASNEITDGTNTVNWSGNVIDNAIGGSGNDSILGSTGANSLFGGAGNDTLNGMDGNDTLDGGTGDDTYAFNNVWGVDMVAADASGNDTLDMRGVANVLLNINLTSSAGTEASYGTNTVNWDNDVIENAYGSNMDDIITGNSANNYLDGGSGSDSLTGGAGNDTLIGGSLGTDTLDGGAGNDSLDGGTNGDLYKFADGFGTDTISDVSGNDTLDFSALTTGFTLSAVSGSVIAGSDSISWNTATTALETILGGSGNDTITGNTASVNFIGNDGNDSLTGSSVADTLSGGNGNDSLSGGAGNDSLSGGAGNDTLIGGDGNDTLDGGTGDDSYVFSNVWAVDTITADSSGNDTLDMRSVANVALTINLTSGAGAEATYGTNTVNWDNDVIENAYGSNFDDIITGNSGANYLEGMSGQDSLVGGSGNDTLVGDDGNDTLIGGTGNDRLDGGTYGDYLDGGDGDDTYVFSASFGLDTITGDSSGRDTVDLSSYSTSLTINLTSGAGNEVSDGGTNTVNWTGDIIEEAVGGSGDDNITGNSGDNTLSGRVGNDTISGGSGNDSLVGGIGNDSLDGGSGDDFFIFGATSSIQDTNTWGNDTITDSSGFDQVAFTNVTASLTINLAAGAGNEVTDGTNTVNWTGDIIESAHGGSGNDSITGSSGDNQLSGHVGDDTLSGGLGSDSLTGGNGNDSLDGGSGDDYFIFGTTSSIQDTNTWGNDTITDSSGTEQIRFTNVTANLTINLTSGAGDEATDGTNTVNWSSDVIENVYSGSGNDSITGSSGANTLQGNGGNDTLNGQAGNDNLDGGAGDDTYQFSGTWGADTITADASGTDTVDLSTVTSNLTINLVSSAGNEISDGTNTVNWSSNIIERVLTGSGADTLTGGTGADYLSASSGNDSLVGAAGNDTLIGSLGNDTLSGGTGNDLYQFSEGDGLDTINENGDTGTNTDKILFDSSVTQSEVAIWMNGSNLEIGNTSASGDKITVQNQNTSGSTIERLELNSGYYLTDADINQVISDMTAYASAHSISLTSLNDVKNDANLMAIVNAGWHT